MEEEITRISMSTLFVSTFRRALKDIRATGKYSFTFEEKESDRTILFELKCKDPMFFFELGKLSSKYFHQL